MASGLLESSTCEEVVLDASNSPRFDINEFLKPPKDFNTDEQFFNFSAFNIPAPTGNMLTPLPPLNIRRSGRSDGGPEPDCNALFFDGKEVDGDAAYAEDTLNEELIAFDETATDIAKDPFAHFNVSLDSYINNPPISPVSLEVPTPVCSLERVVPSMTCPSTICTTGFYMVGDTGGLVDMEDRAFVSVEYGASTSGGAHSMNFSGTPLNWDMVREGSIQPNAGKSQNQQFQCASCQILRRIVHSNGGFYVVPSMANVRLTDHDEIVESTLLDIAAFDILQLVLRLVGVACCMRIQDTKLEIHGCDGQSYHAVLQTRFCIDDGFPASFEQQMVEFLVANAEYVKHFLLQYSLLRRKEGFVLQHDSLASHGSGGVGMGMSSERVMGANGRCISKQIGHIAPPEVLCNSSAYSSSGCTYGKAGLKQDKFHGSGSIDSSDNADASVGLVKPQKSNAAAQHFHLPINAAAKELGICPTVLKKICRRNGMRRWPHRKIKSIERIIATLEQTIAEGSGQGDEGIRLEIAMLRNERAQLCAGFSGDI
uniref:RWP-RK domain-containing protein n=1 Tax=Physcomitrium patens TaxID=3218 RepID=A0A7I4CLI9_PHYPA